MEEAGGSGHPSLGPAHAAGHHLRARVLVREIKVRDDAAHLPSTKGQLFSALFLLLKAPVACPYSPSQSPMPATLEAINHSTQLQLS